MTQTERMAKAVRERWTVRSLAPLAMVPAGGGPPRRLPGMGPSRTRLLAALIALGPAGGTRPRLIEMVWGGPPDPRALSRLRANLFRLRAVLAPMDGGDGVASGSHGRVFLNPARIRVDAWDLLQAQVASPPPVETLLPLLLSVRGRFMESLADGPWLAEYRDRCRAAFRVASARTGAWLLATRRVEDARRLARHAVAVDPEDSAHRDLLARALGPG